jgi:hypothetical protein
VWSRWGRNLGGPGTSLTRNPLLLGTQPGAQPFRFKKISRLAGLLRKGGEKIGEKLKKIGQKIKNFFQKLVPQPE